MFIDYLIQKNMQVPERGIFIPYGKSVPEMAGVKHYTATGHKECKAHQQIITTM